MNSFKKMIKYTLPEYPRVNNIPSPITSPKEKEKND